MTDENDLNNHMASHSDEETDNDVNADTDSESENEEEDLECDEYIEHRGKGDCVFLCNHCDKFFRQE